MARRAIAICLLPALLLAALPGASGARADSSDELQIEGKVDVIELGGEAAPAQSGDARQRLRQACDAAFYAGEQALIARDAKTAATRLQEAAAGCPAETAESVLATAELARLRN